MSWKFKESPHMIFVNNEGKEISIKNIKKYKDFDLNDVTEVELSNGETFKVIEKSSEGVKWNE